MHWRIPQAIVSAHVPRGWEVDTFEGDAWLSVVPFLMERVRVPGLPVLPGFRFVPELNLRTYVRRGPRLAVLFFSLDAASAMLVQAARVTTGLPYFPAAMDVRESDDAITYHSMRRNTDIGFDATYVGAGHPRLANPDTLEYFLHERYLFVNRLGIVGRVFHQPYRLQPATVALRRNDLAMLIPHKLGPMPDATYYADEVDVTAAYEI